MRTLLTIFAFLVLGSPALAASDVPDLPWGNDFGCEPSRDHPRPVVLLHGAGATAEFNWSVVGPRLDDAGYCVFALTYGIGAFGGRPGSIRMEESAQELRAFMARVLRATGARQVDFVGHSEGTVMPRFYLERLGGAPKVKRYVALTPLWRGTAIGGVTLVRDYLGPVGPLLMGVTAVFCGACPEIFGGSAFLEDLNDDGEPTPGVEHINILTRYDSVVVPYTSGLMRGGGENIVLQDVCPDNKATHVSLVVDPAAVTLILNALDPTGPQADPC